jgi:hypothetical protein
MTDETILQRVKKLLALAHGRNATSGEAAAAAAKAQALLLEHNLTLAQVQGMPEPEQYGKANMHLGEASSFTIGWHRDLMFAVARYNFCRAVSYTGTHWIGLIGRPHDVEVVQWLYQYLSREIARLAKDAQAQHGPRGSAGASAAFGRAFCIGAVREIANRMAAARRQAERAGAATTALVHVSAQALEAAFQRHFPKVQKTQGARPKDATAYLLGREAGRRIPLNRPMPGAVGSRSALGR